MEEVLVYGLLFAVLLTAGALVRRPLDRALRAPDPRFVGSFAKGGSIAATGVAVLPKGAILVPRIAGPDPVDLGDLPLAQPRPFDRCWPGTDVPKAGL